MLEILLFAIAAVPGGFLLYERFGWFRRRQGRRVIVHTDDVTYDGLLRKHTFDGAVLAGATIIKDDGSTTSPAGDVFIPKNEIKMVQTNV